MISVNFDILFQDRYCPGANYLKIAFGYHENYQENDLENETFVIVHNFCLKNDFKEAGNCASFPLKPVINLAKLLRKKIN